MPTAKCFPALRRWWGGLWNSGLFAGGISAGVGPAFRPVFFLSPGQGGDDLGIPAGLNWAGRASVTTLVTAPDGLVETIPADCLAAPGYRLEHNQVPASEDFSAGAGWTHSVAGTGQSLTVTPDYIPPVDLDGYEGLRVSRLQAVRVGGANYIDRAIISFTSVAPSSGDKAYESSIWMKTTDGSTQTVTFFCRSTGDTQVVDGTWRRYHSGRGANANAALLTLGTNAQGNADESVDILITGASINYLTGRSNLNPPEYVSVGVESAPMYHGAGVDGYKYFSTTNGNTVNPDGSINEATGSALPGPLRLRLEPTATNVCLYPRDFTQWDSSNGTLSGEVGVDGVVDGATRITDSSGANYEWFGLYSATGGNTGDWSTVVNVLKETRTGAFPAIMFGFTSSSSLGGGEPLLVYVIDPATGDYYLQREEVITPTIEISEVGNFWKIAISAPNTTGLTQAGVRIYGAYSVVLTGSPGSGNTGSIVCDAIQVKNMPAEQALSDSLIMNPGGAADPRAADAPLSWPLVTPQAEGMVIFEGEYAAAGTGGLIGFRTAGAEGPLYKATDTSQACSDSAGTINAVVAAHASDKSLVFAARWSTDEGDKECLNQSSGAWVSASGTKGTWTTDAAVVIGHSITAPLFINTASVYDEDGGGDFIEGNWS